jgi:hypothetical protein
VAASRSGYRGNLSEQRGESKRAREAESGAEKVKGKKLSKDKGRRISLSKTLSHLMLRLPKCPWIAYTFIEVNFRKGGWNL